MLLTKLLYLFPFTHTIDISRAKINHGFCLEGIVYVKLSENGSLVKLLHMSYIPEFPLNSNIENQFL